jgi:hypothetical protein
MKKGLEIIGEDAPLAWSEFEEKVKADIAEVKATRASAKQRVVSLAHSNWIYRGHSRASWTLETSLERFLRDEIGNDTDIYPAYQYYSYLSPTVPIINSLTKEHFETFNPQKIKMERTGPVQNLELICFARHHGFPTPILDWTASCYIAAFFAFRHATKNEDVAIYAYKNWDGRVRGGPSDDPIIDHIGPYIATHNRHHKQQSVYTICRAKIDSETYFMKHEVAVENHPENHRMKKFILKCDEKEKVLENLYYMNINDYTLFGDDEALMRMLAYKEFRNL